MLNAVYHSYHEFRQDHFEGAFSGDQIKDFKDADGVVDTTRVIQHLLDHDDTACRRVCLCDHFRTLDRPLISVYEMYTGLSLVKNRRIEMHGLYRNTFWDDVRSAE